MKYIVAFGRFWYDFIVGDDWTIAVAVLIALGITAVLAASVSWAWITMPVTVTAILGVSILRAAR